MRQALLKFLFIYLLFTVVFIFMKPVFMLVYSSVIDASTGDWLAVIRHGLAMDLSVAGYLTVIPGLLITGQLISGAKALQRALDIYITVMAIVVALIYCLDMGLYGSWGFRLDMTPLFYLTTSPTAAMASIEWWHWIAGAIGIAVISGGMWMLYRHTAANITVTPATVIGRRLWQPAVMLLVTGLLIIPIRGSVTVSTMNLSRAYFSPNPRLNHAALNPAFTLLYSATHQSDFGSQYDFMPDDEAAAIVDRLLRLPDTIAADSVSAVIGQDGHPLPAGTAILTTDRPDIVMVILESFSAHLLPSLGGENVAPGLDSLAREGLLFTNFYASSFRTDRGLAAILGSFPAPPTTSLLKYVEKFEKLPTLSGQLVKHGGYDAAYYYGGDANFTNMMAYLVAGGFDPVISDKDFAARDLTGKWGANDEKLFDRAFQEIKERATASDAGTPTLSVVQTSSSHEPFTVPYANPRFKGKPRRNAFAYTDSCLTVFVDSLATLPNRDRTLIVLVADHYGCWPQNLDSPLDRHHIPLILYGGALATPRSRVDKPASQTDISATLLSMIGLPHESLRYSRDILSPSTTPVAVFTEPSLIGIVTPSDTLVYNPDADAVIYSSTPSGDTSPLLNSARAFLRDLYATLAHL